MYLACRRDDKHKSKWVAVARWNGGADSCLAIAERAFAMSGLYGMYVAWESTMSKQRNFGGFAPDFHEIAVTGAEVDHWCDVRHTRSMLGLFNMNGEELVAEFPELAPFVQEAMTFDLNQ